MTQDGRPLVLIITNYATSFSWPDERTAQRGESPLQRRQHSRNASRATASTQSWSRVATRFSLAKAQAQYGKTPDSMEGREFETALNHPRIASKLRSANGQITSHKKNKAAMISTTKNVTLPSQGKSRTKISKVRVLTCECTAVASTDPGATSADSIAFPVG